MCMRFPLQLQLAQAAAQSNGQPGKREAFSALLLGNPKGHKSQTEQRSQPRQLNFQRTVVKQRIGIVNRNTGIEKDDNRKDVLRQHRNRH